ncbi:hypothetical protein [Massilia sp. Dwa41.01b]|uniref:hypothetical protein n=1 Tax=Massilia sp. Dwa41.01b TaxID=2709302 RepID=UPI00280637C5|nr:hypothetical protein [Massilia sp. Dwa41.01b]
MLRKPDSSGQPSGDAGGAVSPTGFLRRILRPPSIRALLCQCAAFPLTLLAVFVLARAGAAPGYPAAALLQGLFAAALTWC